jgi:iron complex outermembrane recepter protein
VGNTSSRRVGAWSTGVSIAALGCALAVAGGAQAQQAAAAAEDAPEVEEIVVTGFRASLASALSVKRRETEIVDAISAEDIADFPDLNLAESIQRIPGVSIDRDAGEGRSITVRGLGSDFTRTRINGMEAQATTGGTDSSGGANRGRGFDFNVFASELFNRITIRKTAAAEVEEGSLGATVDLITARPFDYKKFTAAGSIQYGYNDLSKEWDPRGAILLSDTWFDGKLGLLGSLAYSERNLFEEGFSSVRWARVADSGGFCSPSGFAPVNPSGTANGASATNCATGVLRPANTAANVTAYQTASGANVYVPRLPRYGRLVHDQSRTGATVSMQLAPRDGTKITLDGLYSKLKATRQENFLEALSFSRNAAAGGQTQIGVRDAAVSAGGDLVYGVFDNVDIRSEQRFDELSTDFQQLTLNVDHEFNDKIRGHLLMGRSVSNFKNPVQTTVTFDRQNSQGFSWDFRDNPDTPLINWGFNVSDPAAWSWRPGSLGTAVTAVPRSEIRLRPQGVRTEFETVQGDFVWDLNQNLRLKFGGNLKIFDSVSYESRRTDETLVPNLPAGVTLASLSQQLTGFGSGLGLPAGSANGWLVPDLNAIVSTFNIYCNCDTGVTGGDFRLTSITNANARASNRTVTEDSLAGYVQLDANGQVGEMPWRGNIGVRQVHTKLFASGYSSSGGGSPVFGIHEYDDTLPSLNLSVDAMKDFVVRFGAAKVMARPQIGNTLAGTNYLVPTTSLAASGPNFTASFGNVNLEPFRANTYDLSFEWYFAPESLVSLAFFYKDIDTYIQILRQDLQYQQLTALNPTAFAPEFCSNPCSPTTIFALTSAVNTKGGPLQGFEISYQQPFKFLPGLLGNTGAILNYTFVKSEIDYCADALCATFVTDDLINLSPHAYNATLYYEDKKLSGRVSLSVRDPYIQNVPGRNNNAVEGKDKTVNIDASASYQLTKNVTLTFEGLNLTDEENRQFVGGGDRESTSVFHHTGRQFYFGARYKY